MHLEQNCQFASEALIAQLAEQVSRKEAALRKDLSGRFKRCMQILHALSKIFI